MNLLFNTMPIGLISIQMFMRSYLLTCQSLPHGNMVTISAFVDANHAGNIVTQCSHTGVLIFVQNTPIIWFLKRQI
jgi:hypothetical protein